MFLVVVEAHSRWLELERMSSTTSEKTIATLQTVFARYGVTAQFVRDNGPELKSEEFEQFLKRNGIKHIPFRRRWTFLYVTQVKTKLSKCSNRGEARTGFSLIPSLHVFR